MMPKPYTLSLILGLLVAGQGIAAEQKDFTEVKHTPVQKISSDEFDDMWNRDDGNLEEKKIGPQTIATESPTEESLFSSPGCALFIQRKYEEAFGLLYSQSLINSYPDRYLVAQYYEYGLGKIYQNPKTANQLYLSIILKSDNELLCERAEEGYARTLHQVKAKTVIDVTDLQGDAEGEKNSFTLEEKDLFSAVGEGYALFTQKKYEEASRHIYCMVNISGLRGHLAQYLMAQYHEYGLGGYRKDLKLANQLYVSVFLRCENKVLANKAEEGYRRTAKSLEF